MMSGFSVLLIEIAPSTPIITIPILSVSAQMLLLLTVVSLGVKANKSKDDYLTIKEFMMKTGG